MQALEATVNMLDLLQEKYGPVKAFLDYKNPFQLLIAVILSAQTTDTMVNKVTPALFERYPDATSLKKAPIEEVEKYIARVNYYRTKAKHIIETAGKIDEEFRGRVPSIIEELTRLPGVGRKVANVVIADIFENPAGVVVDTHVKRVSYRVGWTKSSNPVIIEHDLIKQWPKEYWMYGPKHLILIGRNYCFPKNPNCSECPLNKWCEKKDVKQISSSLSKKVKSLEAK